MTAELVTAKNEGVACIVDGGIRTWDGILISLKQISD